MLSILLFSYVINLTPFIYINVRSVKEMRQQLQENLEKRIEQLLTSQRNSLENNDKFEFKKALLRERQGEVVKVKAKGEISNVVKLEDEKEKVVYHVHLRYLINQKNKLYIEEEIEERHAEFYKGVLVEDFEMNPYVTNLDEVSFREDEEEGDLSTDEERLSFRYDRLKAVQYAEKWWNSYNPAYKKFDVDCTNYISQCIRAGGAPMTGYPNRSKGWWMQNNNWSYSWSVANAMRLYLQGNQKGLRAKEIKDPEQLLLGDVICYDFQGDGRFDHTTIVTAKDALGMPLVNAHTYNSRMRYWSYKDSTAYTPNIKYKFFSIVDDV
jgi:hypothetical protein